MPVEGLSGIRSAHSARHDPSAKTAETQRANRSSGGIICRMSSNPARRGTPVAQTNSIYREEALKRISSPEQLTSYLRVTNPGIWAVLIGVIVLLAGLIAWSTIGTLETTAQATVVVEDHIAEISPDTPQQLKGGMVLRVRDQEYTIDYIYEDARGMILGEAQVDLPDGRYDGIVVIESVHPIRFLFESR